MANPEHEALLKEVAAWNEWRRKTYRGLRPDLRGAGLREAKLSNADLRAADLGGADLRFADLGFAFNLLILLEPVTGIEPATLSLQVRCSTN
jgi:hypothetical protein